MRAGMLNRRATLQERANTVDAWGAPAQDAWADVATVWANVRHLSGVEAIKAGSDVSVVKASIRIRWRTDVTAGMRVLVGDAVYGIEAVLPGEGRAHVDLMATRVG